MTPLKSDCLFPSLNHKISVEATTQSVNPTGLFNKALLISKVLNTLGILKLNLMPCKMGFEYKKHWINFKVTTP